jgi:hypothetical protein
MLHRGVGDHQRERDVVLAEILVPVDADNAGMRERARRVDPRDSGMGVRAPQKGGVESAGQLDVVEVPSLSPEQAVVLVALERLSKYPRRDQRPSP